FELPRLSDFYLRKYLFAEFDQLTSLSALTTLALCGEFGPADIETLASLYGLERLYNNCANSTLTDEALFTITSALPNLKALNVMKSPLSSLDSLFGLDRFEYLNLNRTLISDYSPLILEIQNGGSSLETIEVTDTLINEAEITALIEAGVNVYPERIPKVTGGLGADTFVARRAYVTQSYWQATAITDFQPGTDQIAIAADIDLVQHPIRVESNFNGGAIVRADGLGILFVLENVAPENIDIARDVISYTDISPTANLLLGNWLLDGDGAASVGPIGDDSITYWSSTEADRPCWYDDIMHFGADGSFLNALGNETWVEVWQGGADSCGTPVAPHDGRSTGSFSYDEANGKLTISGKGSYLGLPKAINGSELADPAAAPDSITYDVLSLSDVNLTVGIETGGGVYWTFRLKRAPESTLTGGWQLDGDGAVLVGPSDGSAIWWSSTEYDRPCWYDDIHYFGADGSFINVHGIQTLVETWQGGNESCGTPVAPHDGDTDAVFYSDPTTNSLTILGR
ncbi:MAG: hypothetical protein VW684_15770, partial [Betaproteobacteria bacterium]